jgi:hypothetical protein
MGKRLYRVVAHLRGGCARNQHIVAATAPRHAAALYLESIGPARAEMDATGFALQVGQPAEWFEDRALSSLSCRHGNCETICSSSGTGDGTHYSEHVSICMDCGEITVHTMRDEKHCTVTFGLNCDWHLRAAAKYQRSERERTEALARSLPHGPPELIESDLPAEASAQAGPPTERDSGAGGRCL